MKRHVDFLSWLHLAWGVIFLLVALAGGALAAGAFAIASGSGPVAVASPMAAQFTGFTLVIVSFTALKSSVRACSSTAVSSGEL